MEQELNALIEKLKVSAGTNLKAVVLYGSAVAGDYHAKHSDLNVLCLLERARADNLEFLHPAVEWWAHRGFRPPLVFTFEELRRSADVFAIELLDMKLHHRMLYGEDFLSQLDVPMTLHRQQVERELRTNWVRLRQGILLVPRKRSALIALMTASVSSFAALFRHSLIALGEIVPEGKRAVIQRIAEMAEVDAAPFLTVLDVREGKLKESHADIVTTLRSYLDLVERVTDVVDRRLGGV